MDLHLKTVGWLLVALALIHGIFPRYFQWKSEFGTLSLINRQMIYVHTFFITLTIFFMGLLCITSAKELTETRLGNKVALGFGIFWAIRLLVQLFVYSTKLWRGKKFETAVHVFFILLWTYMSMVFLTVFWTSNNV